MKQVPTGWSQGAKEKTSKMSLKRIKIIKMRKEASTERCLNLELAVSGSTLVLSCIILYYLVFVHFVPCFFSKSRGHTVPELSPDSPARVESQGRVQHQSSCRSCSFQHWSRLLFVVCTCWPCWPCDSYIMSYSIVDDVVLSLQLSYAKFTLFLRWCVLCHFDRSFQCQSCVLRTHPAAGVFSLCTDYPDYP